MSVTMEPLSGGLVEGAYLDVPEARSLGATLPDLTALLAKTDDDLAVLLLAASWDLDAAMPYQGAKYDTTPGGQVREFPRLQRSGGASVSAPAPAVGVGVWDWDSDTQAAVVPKQVKLACVYQAASLLDPSFRGRLEAIRSGLASQSVGSLSESYVTPGSIPGGLSGLCERAQRLMDRYRLRSAPLL